MGAGAAWKLSECPSARTSDGRRRPAKGLLLALIPHPLRLSLLGRGPDRGQADRPPEPDSQTARVTDRPPERFSCGRVTRPDARAVGGLGFNL